MSDLFKPLLHLGPAPQGAYRLAGGALWFTQVERLSPLGRHLQDAAAIPRDMLDALTRPRGAVSGVQMDRTRIMGILNVTPDSFSDGGDFMGTKAALTHALTLAQEADILDIGGESTRPGAAEVPIAEEISRTVPVIQQVAGQVTAPLSIDTRKAQVATEALSAGASILNDVSAMSFDPGMAQVAAQAQVPICLMHAQGGPNDMQDNPRYGDVVFEVYEYLAQRIALAEAAGIARHNIIIDPGIGFGKTLDHNMTLLRDIAVFHTLGCPILVGASRKRFIGTLTGTAEAKDRIAGSVAVALQMAAQGVQILRVHDVSQTRAALTMLQAVSGGTPIATSEAG